MHEGEVDSAAKYQWQPQPQAAHWMSTKIDSLIAGDNYITSLARRLKDETGTRLIDWVDHLDLPYSDLLTRELEELGFCADPPDEMSDLENHLVFNHAHGLFPRICLQLEKGAHANEWEAPKLALKAESIDDFLSTDVVGGPVSVHGRADGRYRCACVHRCETCELWIVERHGWQGFSPPHDNAEAAATAVHHGRLFGERRREFSEPKAGFEHARRLLADAAAELGKDWACDLFFAAERAFWQSRNFAAQVQHRRQSALGLGWANHDHHTYRSSRRYFGELIRTLESMGFVCRERFYAGREAGWGAQVLVQPNCNLVVFADVDLSPGEVQGDFAHQGLEDRHELGTVGLWCRLHGEAFLEAGLHHLECQFDFDTVRGQLSLVGINSMAPFTDFPFLKQAFTEGEIWAVTTRHLETALSEGLITSEEAARFRAAGALGSHLEILERNEGYKGFNQSGISEIIGRTDPRTANV